VVRLTGFSLFTHAERIFRANAMLAGFLSRHCQPIEMRDLPAAPASRLPQAEAAGPSSLLRNGQDQAATSAQLRGLRQPARPNPKRQFVRLAYCFGNVSYRLSPHLALRDFIRSIAAGTAFIV
jgi:hypothetical protein